MLDGKYALMSTRIAIGAKEIISAYYDKDGIEKAFCCNFSLTTVHCLISAQN